MEVLGVRGVGLQTRTLHFLCCHFKSMTQRQQHWEQFKISLWFAPL